MPVDSSVAKLPNGLSALILFFAVATAPLPFGSTAPIIIAVWCVVLGAALVLASPFQMRKPQFIPFVVLGVLAAAYLVVLHEQLASAPWFASVSPIWSEASKLLATASEPPVASVARNEPFYSLGAALCFILCFATSYIVCADRHRSHQLLQVVAWSGVVYALIGVAQFVLDPGGLLWREKTAYLSSLTGTFVNRNAAAVYFGSCSIVCLLLLLQELKTHRRSTGSARREHGRSIFAGGRIPMPLATAAAKFAVLLVATLMTGSRAGVVLSLLGLVSAFAIFRARESNRRQHMWLLAAVGGGVALTILQFFAGGVGQRFDQSGLGDTARLDAYRSTVSIIADNLWFGSGLGTFTWSFPPYRADGSIWGTWNRAHDTILEIASEGGLPLTLLIGFAWVLVLAALVWGIRVRHRDLIVPTAAISMAAVALLHSLVDFSLQLPGYSIVIAAVVGAGLAQSFPSRRSAGLP